MTIEDVLKEEIGLAKQQIDFGYENKCAEDIVEGHADLKALVRFLSKCHDNRLLMNIDVI